MTVSIFWISYGFLWLTVGVLAAGVVALYRYVGTTLLNLPEERIKQGPEVGANVHRLLDGMLEENSEESQDGGPSLHLLFFGSPVCRPCKTARDPLSHVAEGRRGVVKVVAVMSGRPAAVQEYTSELSSKVTVVRDIKSEISSRLRIAKPPFAFVVDSHGIVRAKGGYTTLDGFEQLLQDAVDSVEAVRQG
jgi:hypothetical protein